MGIIIGIGNYIGKGKSTFGDLPPESAILAEDSSYIITENKLYILVEREPIVYPGLIAAWSAAGKTNNDVDKNILEDLTGNGHDIILNNFSFSEMSGYGGYNTDFLSGNIGFHTKQRTSTKIIIDGTKNGLAWYRSVKTEFPSFKVKVTGLSVAYFYVDKNGVLQEMIIGDGEHKLPISYASSTVIGNNGFRTDSNYGISTDNGTIELLPEYPDALVFDGVDDYGINEDMPILTDYTVIYDREIIDIPISDSMFITDGGDYAFGNAFGIEKYYAGRYYTTSMRHQIEITDIIKKNRSINYQTLNKYNGVTIGNITDTSLGKKEIFLFKNKNSCSKGAFYSAYLFDRSLDELEIKSFIRKYIDPEYLLPSEQLT